MKKNNEYLKIFTDENKARQWMVMKNQTAADKSIFCLVDGPDDDFAVVDLDSAIELGGLYTWSMK